MFATSSPARKHLFPSPLPCACTYVSINDFPPPPTDPTVYRHLRGNGISKVGANQRWIPGRVLRVCEWVCTPPGLWSDMRWGHAEGPPPAHIKAPARIKVSLPRGLKCPIVPSKASKCHWNRWRIWEECFPRVLSHSFEKCSQLLMNMFFPQSFLHFFNTKLKPETQQNKGTLQT